MTAPAVDWSESVTAPAIDWSVSVTAPVVDWSESVTAPAVNLPNSLDEKRVSKHIFRKKYVPYIKYNFNVLIEIGLILISAYKT